MYKHILVPVDGSLLAAETIDAAARLGGECGARLTFLHVEPDETDDIYGDAALLSALSPGEPAADRRRRSGAILAKAHAAAVSLGVSCQAVSRVGRHPHQAIIRAAEEHCCDLIFMASHGRRSTVGMMIGSETLKTLIHSPIPVLVSSVATNTRAPYLNAIAVIRDDHHCLAAVIDRAKRLTRDIVEGGIPDLTALDSVALYLREFSANEHHPREEMHLFARLAARTGELDPILEELHRQHADETGLVGALEASIGEFAAHPEQGAGAMSAAVAAFAGHAARHMRIEEDVVIPAARRLFSENDWRDLDAAFTAAATGPAAGRLRSLFGDIVNGDASRG